MRTNIERGFSFLSQWLFSNRLKSLLMLIIFVAAMISGLPKLTIDTSTEGFLHDNDPTLIAYNAFRDQFGQDDVVIVAVRPPEVFDQGFLKRLQQLHERLEAELPFLDEVTSLVNARNTRGEGDTLIVEDLLENFPENEAVLSELKQRVLSNPLYRDLLISGDANFTTLVIRASSTPTTLSDAELMGGFDDTSVDTEATPSYLSDAQSFKLVTAVKNIAADFRGDEFSVSIAGSPVVTHALKQTIMADMRKFMALALGAIGIFLFIMFRRASGVLLPLVIVVISLLSTLGLMGHFGVAVKVPTQILPSFLLAVSVGASVHVLAIFFYRLYHGDDKQQAIVRSYAHSGLPIMMTSLTTAAGLASFSTAEIAPIADLGQFAAFGVMLSFLYTLVLLPIAIALLPIRTGLKQKEQSRTALLDGMLRRIAYVSTHYPRRIVGASALLMALALYSITLINFSHNPLTWLPQSLDVRQSTEIIDANLKGSVTMEVIIDTGRENGVQSPDMLNRLDRMSQELAQWKQGDLQVGKAWSLVDVVKEINRALNENRDSHYRIPQNPQLVSQELLLFSNSGSDDLEDFTDSQFSQARLTLKTPWVDSVVYSGFTDAVQQRFEEVFAGEATITVTGIVALLGRTLHAAMISMSESYVIAVIAISLMMILLLGSLRMGLIAMIPNLFPIILALGLMGVLGWPLDLFTMLIGAIALGLAVDDTVHFMHNFRHYHGEGASVHEAVEHTLLTAGRAMLVTTIVLSLGFFVFMFSSMSNLFNFGLLTGVAIIFALVSDFLLAPALMALLYSKKATQPELAPQS